MRNKRKRNFLPFKEIEADTESVEDAASILAKGIRLLSMFSDLVLPVNRPTSMSGNMARIYPRFLVMSPNPSKPKFANSPSQPFSLV